MLLNKSYADAILEVVAGKRIVPEEKLDTEAYAAEVEKAKIEGRVPPPPPPPPLSRTMTASVQAVFKGKEAVTKTSIIIETDLSSCGWLPQEGSRYLLYLSVRKNSKGEVIFGVGSCSRKVSTSSPYIKLEYKVLEALASTDNGKLLVAQPNIMDVPGPDYVPFSGEIKDCQREGTWLLYPPVFYRRDSVEYGLPVMALEYEFGLLKNVTALRKTNRRGVNAWFNGWVFEFFMRNE